MEIRQVIAKIDPKAFAGGKDGEDGGDLWPGFFAADMDPMLAAKGDGVHSVFAEILVDLNDAPLLTWIGTQVYFTCKNKQLSGLLKRRTKYRAGEKTVYETP